MNSGESIDPRGIEAALDQCPAIARSCVVGNNFLRTSSQVICAIVEPARDAVKSSKGLLSEITRAIASANRSLAPPLRISWSRVLVLKDQHIPITKKGAIFRKKLEEFFGDQLASLIVGSEHQSEANAKPSANLSQGKIIDQVSSIISNIVVETLRISTDMLENNAQATFAEVSTFFFLRFYCLLMYYVSSEWTQLWLR
jgi:long-subunit acyl-CoA synthetase (AMP-forming)